MAKPKPIEHIFTSEQAAAFWQRVDISETDKCWPYRVTNPVTGYGTHCLYLGRVDGQIKAKNYRAHRVAYYLASGDDPRELDVLHTCDVPPCCNPSHLFKGTVADNMEDKMQKGRGKFPGVINQPKGECHAMAKLTEAQVHEIRRVYQCADLSTAQIAQQFGICAATVTSIAKGKTWRHLKLEPISQSKTVRSRGDAHWMRRFPEKARIHAQAMIGLSKQGESGGNAKLTDGNVIEIRRRFADGNISKYRLAKEYGTTKQNVTHIIARRTWTHLP